MARRPTQQPPSEKEWTPDTIRSALRKLRRRLSDVEAFEPQKVPRRRDATVIALEASLKETLADVYGPNSRSFQNYELACQIDTATHNINGVPHDEVIEGYVLGKDRSIRLLSGAIRALEEKMEDDFPGEPLDRVALQASGFAAGMGSASIGVNDLPGMRGANPLHSGLQGVGTGLPEPQRAALESRYTELQARVALLESSVEQLRRELSPREFGIGHNQGPAFAPVPVEELGEIDRLIELLKDRGPLPPSDPMPLIEQNAKVAAIGEQINKGLVSLGLEIVKGAAREAGKEVLAAHWSAVCGWIKSVGVAMLSWLGFS